MDFAIPADHSEKRGKYLDLVRELVKHVELEGYSNTCSDWHTWNGPQRIGKRTGRTRNWRTNRDYPDYSIVKIGLNTEKSPGNLSGVALIQSPVKYD